MGFLNSIGQFVLGVVVTGLSVIGVQTPITPPTLALSALPVTIQLGDSTTIDWSSTGATECVSGYFDTQKKTSGSVSVSPSQTTTYSVTCSKTQDNSTAESGVWKFVGTDYTDLWCTAQKPSFKNLYTENPCPSGDPAGQSCSTTGSDLCAVNKWQTKAADGRTTQLSCNLISELYRCVSGSSQSATNAPAPVTGTKTVFSGEFGDLVVGNYRGELQKDVNANGGPFTMDGFYDDKATADRICSVLFSGSTNGSYRNDKYKSPKNNTLLKWDGTRWTQQGAKSHKYHLRYNFTCVAPGAAQPPPKPLPTTITKSVTVIVVDPTVKEIDTNPSGNGGAGGGNQCSDGIDNDNDGKVDGDDYGCSVGGNESPNPQCSDGLDNNGNGFIDLADVGACTGPTDNNEFFPDGAVILTTPSLVQQNTSASISWSVSDVRTGTCSISGSNGDSWQLSGTSGTITTSALSSETTYTLSCTDLNARPVTVKKTIKVVPIYTEQ